MTREEFERLPDDGVRHELSQGELVTLTRPKLRHTLMQMRLLELLLPAQAQGFGKVLFEPGCELAPDTIRSPDVCFITAHRAAALSPDNHVEGAPNLAIEIVSPSEFAEDLHLKVRQYLTAGAQAVWVIYP